MEKFDVHFCSKKIMVDRFFNRAIKVEEGDPSFLMVNCFLHPDRVLNFRLNCGKEIAIGVADKRII